MNLLLRAICATLADQPADWSTLSRQAWQNLPETAELHGVLALLHERWTSIGWPEAMPPATQNAFTMRHYAQSAHTFLLYEQLPIILQALGPEQPVILLKGAALGTTLYRRPELRPLRDIDVLVHADKRTAARQALEALGYVKPPRAIDDLTETHGQIQLHGGPARNISLELHWRLAGSTTKWLSPSSDWFWQQSESWQPHNLPAGSAFPNARQLLPTAHLLYLAAHLVLQHGGAQARLIWLYDLHLLLTQRAEQLDWDELVDRARAFHWSAAMAAALDATNACFGSPVPQPALRALRASADVTAARYVQQRETYGGHPLGTLWLKAAALAPGTRARYLWRVFFPSPAYLRSRYDPRPAWLWPLCYPYRWLSAIGRVLRASLALASQHIVRRTHQ